MTRMMVAGVMALLMMGLVWAGNEPSTEVPSTAELELMGDSGGLTSLRGDEVDASNKAEQLKRVPKDRAPLPRDYVHQPPLIPHQIRGYEIDKKANKCLSCHSWKMASQTGATRISPTHFETREGVTLGDVSPRRYFCLQCHVEQADAKPLVTNEFQPVKALSGQ